MANRKYFLAALFTVCCYVARAQTISFQQVDSTSYAQYSAGNWKALIAYGNTAINAGADYPALRLRMAYAQLMTENYQGALTQYQQVLKMDAYNQTARYFSYLCNKYLDNNYTASYHASFVDTAVLDKEKITAFGLLTAGLETGIKIPANSNRGKGSYTRASLSNRLGWKLQLDQSVAYYNQSITSTENIAPDPATPTITTPVNTTFSNQQFEYYGKLGYTITNRLTLLGAYHYLNTSYGSFGFQSHIGLLGLKYSAPYFSLQADANYSNIINSRISQVNGQVTIYPLGNLNLYTISRVAVQSGDIQQTILNQAVGFKVAKQLWLEASATFGAMNNYLEADALYVYNAIDITKQKAGATIFYTLGKHAVVHLNYTFEQKQDYYLNNDYNQNSITGGLTWKF
jgi:hypothetical protein